MSGDLVHGAFRLTSTGLVVKGKPSFDAWEECGSYLQRIEGAIQFWIGDWLNFGQHAYGEKYAQAVSETQAETWRHYAWVSDNVDACIRIHNLSWSHHLQVAKLHDTPDVQRDLLAQALPSAAVQAGNAVARLGTGLGSMRHRIGMEAGDVDADEGRTIAAAALAGRSYWPGLFHCYTVPELPRTN